MALVGESGCGKSTVARSVMRLLEPLSGSVLLDGVDVLKLRRSALHEQRRRMQMIFQDPFAALDPRIDIGSAIAEPLLVNKLASRAQARDRVDDPLQRVGLQPGMARRSPHEFSGGQRQRICIARALALEPRLIVADESVSALDVSVKAQVVNVMLDLQARMGLAYLSISHDMSVVERVSHRVAVMYLGEIVEMGPREAVFGNRSIPTPDACSRPCRSLIRRGASQGIPSSVTRSRARCVRSTMLRQRVSIRPSHRAIQ